MGSWQLSPCYFETLHHLTQAWNRCLPTWTFVIYFSITPDVCYVSRPKRCYYVSFHELIVSCSIFEKIESCRVYFCRRVGWRSRKQRCQDQDDAMNQRLWGGYLDREDCVSSVSPLSSYLTSWTSGWDSRLVGVSCHSPSFNPTCLCISGMHHVSILL